jgi:hypothetical protein
VVWRPRCFLAVRRIGTAYLSLSQGWLGRPLTRRSVTRKGRSRFHERPCVSDAWLSCAGSGEWAPEVGNSEPVNAIQGSSVPPPNQPPLTHWGGELWPRLLTACYPIPLQHISDVLSMV